MMPVSRPLGSCIGIVNAVLRSPNPRKVNLAQKADKPHRITLVPARSLGFWSRKEPIMSNSKPTSLPRGAWDSHVHVVDEVSDAVQAVMLDPDHLRRKPSPSRQTMHSGRRKHSLRTY